MITESDALSEVRQITEKYLQDFITLVQLVDVSAIERISHRLASVSDSGSTIYVAGNGGSAAIASHWVNDLGKATKCNGRNPMRVMCLSDNVSWLTALANDEGYERVFSGQLENFAKAGDLLVVISSSGNSMNLVSAVELAKTRSVYTVGFLGFDGGVLKQKVDDYVLLPTEKGAYGLVEPGHEMICHLITKCLAQGSVSATSLG
jgi:D-sedoheptulose 7-phosphate isomerase